MSLWVPLACLKHCETADRFSTFVVRSVKGSSWSTNKGYKEVIFLSACSSRCVKEKKILGFLENSTLWTINLFLVTIFKKLSFTMANDLCTSLQTIDVLFCVINVTLFAGVPFLAHPRVLRNETVSELIVTTTSVKKCFLLSTNSMYLNERYWFLWAIRISLLARSNDNSVTALFSGLYS